jgi:Cys-rich protein (TIGR01571 family)
MSEKAVLLAKATPVEESSDEVGKWKSGLCDCCKYGACHKALLTAWCCAPLLLGQLLTRMKMTWLGEGTTTSEQYMYTFRNVLIVAIVDYIINSIYSCTPDLPDEVDGEIVMVPGDCTSWQLSVTSWVDFFFWLYTFICLVRLRVAVRAKYNIPEENCEGCEDEVCILCCPCLSAVQIAHQTADYDNEKAYFFTKSGLSNETMTEAIVV